MEMSSPRNPVAEEPCNHTEDEEERRVTNSRLNDHDSACHSDAHHSIVQIAQQKNRCLRYTALLLTLLARPMQGWVCWAMVDNTIELQSHEVWFKSSFKHVVTYYVMLLAVLLDLIPRFFSSIGNAVRYFRTENQWLVLVHEVGHGIIMVSAFATCVHTVRNQTTTQDAILNGLAIMFVMSLDAQWMEAVLNAWQLRRALKKQGFDPKTGMARIARGGVKGAKVAMERVSHVVGKRSRTSTAATCTAAANDAAASSI